jgi:hypothetical protein
MKSFATSLALAVLVLGCRSYATHIKKVAITVEFNSVADTGCAADDPPARCWSARVYYVAAPERHFFIRCNTADRKNCHMLQEGQTYFMTWDLDRKDDYVFIRGWNFAATYSDFAPEGWTNGR